MRTARGFNAASLTFAAYWADDMLARDYRILVTCGHVQRQAAAEGRDCPSGWFYRAAMTYPTNDVQGRLAHLACTRVAMALEEGVAS